MKEVTAVLKTGLDKLLADYNDRYTLYQETHKCVVKLQGLLGNGPSPQSDTRYDKLEKQIEQMKEEIALLKGKPICDVVDDDTQIAVKTESVVKTQVKQEPVVKTESSVKTEPVVKTESSVKTELVVKTEPVVKTELVVKTQVPDEKENITLIIELIIEPVQKQESEGEEESEEESEGEEESEEEQESEGEELSDEEEEVPAVVAPVPAPVPAPADDEDEELFEIEIDDVSYCTNDEENGIIYALTADGDVGAKVGYLKDGEPIFE